PASHVGCAIIWGLFVDKENEPQACAFGLPLFEQARQLNHSRRSGGIVVGAWRILVGIVVRANHKGRYRHIAARISYSLNVANVATIDRKFLATYGIPKVLQLALNVLSRSFQLPIMSYIVWSAGDGHHVRSESRRQIALFGSWCR